ncbi:hypothetical protein BC777_1919 [Yoonia maricola]|uniref:Antibiotic biosynthesis monooxygenase n=1 Tax=Yoonia maricola TaxID=420999 RepID=A0A2M8WQ45_9RHOB|nr:hypothetical protein [Yoonia maricola]PJI93052.1 hypothetical protein BC777_1919 [Yoonia maricola]
MNETEPGTVLWFALQADDTLAIFDILADNSGREAHFAGQVAGLLNDKASELVSGGWDDGVVANVHNFDVLAIK